MTVFVLRCWLEPQLGAAGAWRASLYDPNSRERLFFSDPSDLTRYFTQASDLQQFDLDAPLERDLDPPPFQGSKP